MNSARRFLVDDGQAPLRPVPTSFAAMLCIAASLVVLAIVAGCIIGRAT